MEGINKFFNSRHPHLIITALTSNGHDFVGKDHTFVFNMNYSSTDGCFNVIYEFDSVETEFLILSKSTLLNLIEDWFDKTNIEEFVDKSFLMILIDNHQKKTFNLSDDVTIMRYLHHTKITNTWNNIDLPAKTKDLFMKTLNLYLDMVVNCRVVKSVRK